MGLLCFRLRVIIILHHDKLLVGGMRLKTNANISLRQMLKHATHACRSTRVEGDNFGRENGPRPEMTRSQHIHAK